jgi:8-oxo-dGTP diphosphatase
MSRSLLSPADRYASLPTVYASACMLLTDPHDQVLLVKPNYRTYWAIPGGMVDAGEAPHECVSREVAEELGLDISAAALLVADWVPPQGARPRVMTNYIFDGRTIQDPQAIRLQHDELDDAQFFTWEQAETRMPANTAARIPASRRARKDGPTARSAAAPDPGSPGVPDDHCSARSARSSTPAARPPWWRRPPPPAAGESASTTLSPRR